MPAVVTAAEGVPTSMWGFNPETVLVLFTGAALAALWFAYQGAKRLKEQVDMLQKEHADRMRAWVGIDDIDWPRPGEQYPGGACEAKLRNVGMTVATDVHVVLDVARESVPSTVGTLLPGMPFEQTFEMTDRPEYPGAVSLREGKNFEFSITVTYRTAGTQHRSVAKGWCEGPGSTSPVNWHLEQAD